MECLLYILHENTPHRDGICPRFHPVCFSCKNLLIKMITESPCRIRATPRWFSDCFFTKVLPAYEPLSGMSPQLTVLFNAFSLCRHSTSNFFLCQGLFPKNTVTAQKFFDLFPHILLYSDCIYSSLFFYSFIFMKPKKHFFFFFLRKLFMVHFLIKPL